MSGYSIARKNIFMTWFLFGIFLLILYLIGLWFEKYTTLNNTIIIVMLVFVALRHFYSFYNADKIAIKSANAIPAEEYGELGQKAINAVENMSLAAAVKMPKVYVIPSEGMNAFASGRNEDNAVIAITAGLLKNLDKREVEAVVAHELGHIMNRDIMLMSLVMILIAVFELLAEFARSFVFSDNSDSKKSPLYIAGIIMLIIFPFLSHLIQLAISRKREFLADAKSAEITRNPQYLIRALRKISQNPEVSEAKTNLSHLFIAEPVKNKRNWLSKIQALFYTHPPIEERIAVLEKM